MYILSNDVIHTATRMAKNVKDTISSHDENVEQSKLSDQSVNGRY